MNDRGPARAPRTKELRPPVAFRGWQDHRSLDVEHGLQVCAQNAIDIATTSAPRSVATCPTTRRRSPAADRPPLYRAARRARRTAAVERAALQSGERAAPDREQPAAVSDSVVKGEDSCLGMAVVRAPAL